MEFIKKFIKNKRVKNYLHKLNRKYSNFRLSKNPVLNSSEFVQIVKNELGINNGDTVFIHSSIDKLNLSCSPFDILNSLLDIVGQDGNLLFPTYPNSYSYNFLADNKIFNQKLTPSATGILSEIARRHKKAVRSLHPTKSVVAIGKDADYFTITHHNSPYPYDFESPYFKIYKFKPKIIGLGIKTTYLSCVHTVDDTYKNNFAVEVYDKQLFEANCVNMNGEKVIVKTYAHNMDKMIFNLPKFFKQYIPKDICSDLSISGYDFFRADGEKLYSSMIDLYETDKITIYPRSIYRTNR